MKEVLCPACGALIEAPTTAELIDLAKQHALVAHNYKLPTEHILAAMTL